MNNQAENRLPGEADQVEAWGRALYEANAFYAERTNWSEMASPDGGIKDLHHDMARAAKAVWDAEDDDAPASDLEQVSRERDEAVRLLRLIAGSRVKEDNPYLWRWCAQVLKRSRAFLNNLDNRND